MKNKINDYDCLIELFKKNGIDYREIESYNEKNEPFSCLWLNIGHIEFYKDKSISNIVNY